MHWRVGSTLCRGSCRPSWSWSHDLQQPHTDHSDHGSFKCDANVNPQAAASCKLSRVAWQSFFARPFSTSFVKCPRRTEHCQVGPNCFRNAHLLETCTKSCHRKPHIPQVPQIISNATELQQLHQDCTGTSGQDRFDLWLQDWCPGEPSKTYHPPLLTRAQETRTWKRIRVVAGDQNPHLYHVYITVIY